MNNSTKNPITIYPMEVAANKISNLLDEVIKTQPGMYEKTRVRYKDLALNLLSSTDKIFQVLQQSSLDTQKPSEDQSTDILDSSEKQFLEVFQSLSSRVSSREAFLYSDKVPKNVTSIKSISSRKLTKEKESNISDDFNELACSLPDKYAKSIAINKFRDVLKEASCFNFGYEEVNRCAYWLYYWFHTRYVVKYSGFRYNIKLIPLYIESMILYYSYLMNTNQLENFESEMKDWESAIKTNNTINVPYGAFDIYKQIYHYIYKDYATTDNFYKYSEIPDPMKFTLEAVVINDVLTDGVLHKLMDSEFANGYITYDPLMITQLVRNINIGISDKVRMRIPKRQEYLSTLNFTKVSEEVG